MKIKAILLDVGGVFATSLERLLGLLQRRSPLALCQARRRKIPASAPEDRPDLTIQEPSELLEAIEVLAQGG